MEKEYSRAERVSISYGGSSAQVIRGEDLDPAVRRRKDAETEGADNRFVEMFCERYHDRGIAGRVHRDVAEQEKREALHRAEAPGTYVMTDTLGHINGEDAKNTYRSGVSDGKAYMTADDFRRYYHHLRGYRNPQYRTAEHTPESRAAVRAMVEAREAARGVNLPKKAGWLTNLDKLPALVRRALSNQKIAKVAHKLNVWAEDTFPREIVVKESAEQKKLRRPLPVGLVATLVTVAVSMAMVISSTVLVSQSTRELSQIKEEIAAKDAIVSEITDQLDLKNGVSTVRDRATGDLGMVPEEYLDNTYIPNASEDYVEVFDEEGEGGGLSALLSAFGFGD